MAEEGIGVVGCGGLALVTDLRSLAAVTEQNYLSYGFESAAAFDRGVEGTIGRVEKRGTSDLEYGARRYSAPRAGATRCKSDEAGDTRWKRLEAKRDATTRGERRKGGSTRGSSHHVVYQRYSILIFRGGREKQGEQHEEKRNAEIA